MAQNDEIASFNDIEAGVTIKNVIKAGISMNKGPQLAAMLGKGNAKFEVNKDGHATVTVGHEKVGVKLSEMAMKDFGIAFGDGAVSVSIVCTQPDENGLSVCKGTVTGFHIVYGSLSGNVNFHHIDAEFTKFLDNTLVECHSGFFRDLCKAARVYRMDYEKEREKQAGL
jgi:hypothetical protein